MICTAANQQTEDGYCEFCGGFMDVPVDAAGFRQEAYCTLQCREAQAAFEAEGEALFDPRC